jgi:NAD(P)-dependent dehydrogenase (short-subunit alcohol dehydrogenase family)
MTIFITGASKGIGYAIAAKFLTACTGEIQLAICARNAAEIEQARSTLARLNSSAVILAGVCDVADETSVKQFIGRVQNEFGAIDVLVNNAGFGIFKTVSELTAKNLTMLSRRICAAFFLSRKLCFRPCVQKRLGRS